MKLSNYPTTWKSDYVEEAGDNLTRWVNLTPEEVAIVQQLTHGYDESIYLYPKMENEFEMLLSEVQIQNPRAAAAFDLLMINQRASIYSSCPEVVWEDTLQKAIKLLPLFLAAQ